VNDLKIGSNRKQTARRTRSNAEEVMKSAKNRIMVSLAAVVVMGLTISNAPLYAQSTALKVEIPFAFHAGETTLPAGTYIVTRQGDAIRLSDGNGHATSVISNSVNNPAKGATNELAFNRYSGDYFLEEVRWIGHNSAQGLMKSRAEMELAKAARHEDVKLAALTTR
jgi:hypothetical protein